MKILNNILDKIEDILCTVFACVMAVSILIQVVNRNTVRIPASWCEELARYCMVWLIFVGISAGVKQGSHIGVDALVNAFPENTGKIIKKITSILATVMYAVLTVLSIMITAGIRETGQVSPAMRIPMYIVYAGLIVGLFMSTLRSLQTNIKVLSQNDGSKNNVPNDAGLGGGAK